MMGYRLAEEFLNTTRVDPDWFVYELLKFLDPENYNGDDFGTVKESLTIFMNKNGQTTGIMKITEKQIVIERREK